MQKSITKSFQETQHIATELAQQILQRGLGKKAVILGLQGDLNLQSMGKGLRRPLSL